MRQRNLAKTITALTALVIMLTFVPGATVAQEGNPGEQQGTVPDTPELDVAAWALVDAESGLYLAGENPDEQLPVGSTTKVMAALVAFEQGADLDEEVTISEEAESFVGGTFSNAGLIQGERVSVEDLLVASMIPSGTDAIYALAEHQGGGSVANFVEEMNAQVSTMGLQNTNFESPAGLDTPENYSSVRDLAERTRAALEYPLFAEIVDTTDATISTQNASGDREIEVFNTNQLLNTYPPATGVKTGTTPEGGASLISSAEADDESYIAVVIGAEDSDARFLASEAVLEYGFGSFDRQSLVSQDEVYEELPLPYRRGQSVELVAAEDITVPTAPGVDVERRATTVEPPPSAETGQELGDLELLVNGESAGYSPLVAREGYEEASFLQWAWYGVVSAWDWVWSSIGSLLS